MGICTVAPKGSALRNNNCEFHPLLLPRFNFRERRREGDEVNIPDPLVPIGMLVRSKELRNITTPTPLAQK